MLVLPGGYALVAIQLWWMLSGVSAWTCTTDPTYAKDQLPPCPPFVPANLTLMLATLVLNAMLGLELVLPVVGSVYLARRACRSNHGGALPFSANHMRSAKLLVPRRRRPYGVLVLVR